MNRNIPLFKEVYNWFNLVLTIITPTSQYLSLGEITSDADFGSKMAEYLRMFGTGITGFTFLEVNPLAQFPKSLIESLQRDIKGKEKINLHDSLGEHFIIREDESGELKASKLMFTHRMTDCDEEVSFDPLEESDGTRRLMDLLPTVLSLHQKRERVLLIDEFDRSLHPHLTYKLLSLFLSNQDELTQLIFTTHQTHLLDLDILRRDQIWFIEKDYQGESIIYSLEDFAPRYDKDIEKGYLLGRFGGIPVFGDVPFTRQAVDDE